MRLQDLPAAERLLIAGVAAFCLVAFRPVECLAQPAAEQSAAPFDAQDAQPPAPAGAADLREAPESSVVRRLLAALDEMDVEQLDAGEQRERELWRSRLLDADEVLHRATRESSRQLMLKANQRRCGVKGGAYAYGVTYYYHLRQHPYQGRRGSARNDAGDAANTDGI